MSLTKPPIEELYRALDSKKAEWFANNLHPEYLFIVDNELMGADEHLAGLKEMWMELA